MRLILLLAPLLLLASSCSVIEKKEYSVGAEYSGHFVRWFYGSLGVRFEIADLRDALIPASEEARAWSALQELAQRQARLNGEIRSAQPPDGWEGFHENMLQAVIDFEATTAEIRSGAAGGSLRDQIALLGEAETWLRMRVTECYAQATTCR